MKRVPLTLITLTLVGQMASPLQGQGLGNLFGSKKDAPSAAGQEKADLDSLLARGTLILVSLGLATDQSYAAEMKMLEAFPPEVVADIKVLAEKYNETRKNRPSSGAPDASEFKAKSELDAAFAGLEGKWKSYKKDKATVVGPAYTKVGFALGIDALAAAQVPEFLKTAKAALSGGSSNPFQMKKIGAVTTLVTTLGVVADTLPKQVASLGKVRGIAKDIAAAEKITLVEPPAVKALDPKVLESESKELS